MTRISEDSGQSAQNSLPRTLPALDRSREGNSGARLPSAASWPSTAPTPVAIPGGWFLDPGPGGGGAVMDHAVHVADLLRWMLDTEVKSVFAEVDSFFGAEGTEDAAILTLELEGGPIAAGTFATIDPSWSRGEGYPVGADVRLRISAPQASSTSTLSRAP